MLEQRGKTTPEAIFDRGLRDRERDRVWPLLTRMRSADLGLVDEEKLRETYQRYLAGEAKHGFWPALTLEDWLRRYF